MPGCAAVGCFNSTKKGFLMKKFPKDPQRRKLWTIKSKRDKWVSADSSVPCEAHFEHHMWEKTREDGSRILKADAVPTLFFFTKPQIKRKAPVKKKLYLTSSEIEITSSLHRNGSPIQGSSQDCDGLLNEQPVSNSSKDCLQQKSPLDHSFEEAPSHSQMAVNPNSSSDGTSSGGKTIFQKLSKKKQLTMYFKLCKRKTSSLKRYRNKLKCAFLKFKQLQGKELYNNSEIVTI